MLQKDDTIVPTFEPSFLQGGTMEPEEAVRRLLTNYAYHVASFINSELLQYLKNMVLANVLYYLTVALPQDIARPSFSTKVPTRELNLDMIAFCHTIYPQWKGRPSAPAHLIESHLVEARTTLDGTRQLFAERSAPPTPTPAARPPSTVSTVRAPSYCQVCFAPASTKHVEFYENVGALIMRFHRSIKGNLCKPCIDAYFWNFTGKTALLGWWGVISFLITPFIILNNSVRFISSIGMTPPTSRTGPSASPIWIFTTIAAYLAIAFFACSLFLGAFAANTSVPIAPIATQPFSVASSTRPTAKPRPTNTTVSAVTFHGMPCKKWNQVAPSMVDSFVCVYGPIYSFGPYSNKWNTIYFSSNPSSFRVIDFNYFYSTTLTLGNCARVYGRVRDYGPYLIITPDKSRSDSVTTGSLSACQ